MKTPAGQVLAVLVAGVALAGVAWLGVFSSGLPTVYCPMPTLTFIPALVLSGSGLYRLALLVPVFLFFVWNPCLFQGSGRVPIRSLALLGLASLLSVVYFVEGWKFGVQYQGIRYVQTMSLANVLSVILLGAVFFRARRAKTSFWNNLFTQWLLFAWLAWFAFPTLGELP
jgi:hypothetical protein